MSTYDNLEQLVGTFQRDVALAKDLKSSNSEDDLAIKSAVVGFSYNSPTQHWTKVHYEFLKARLERDYHDQELAEYGDNPENVKLFFALALGYLLGLYEEGRIDNDEFMAAEQQLAGLIMLHLAKLTAQPV